MDSWITMCKVKTSSLKIDRTLRVPFKIVIPIKFPHIFFYIPVLLADIGWGVSLVSLNENRGNALVPCQSLISKVNR